MAKKKAAKQDLSAEAQRAKAEGPSFEERLARVEEIVERLESGEAGLDESLRLYAEGAELVKACRKVLKEAETRITQLAESTGGELKEEPFEPEEET
jgi:exodeoxyribonuclease VII small subunit